MSVAEVVPPIPERQIVRELLSRIAARSATQYTNQWLQQLDACDEALRARVEELTADRDAIELRYRERGAALRAAERENGDLRTALAALVGWLDSKEAWTMPVSIARCAKPVTDARALVAEPEKCPTCSSDEPAWPYPTSLTAREQAETEPCPDAWHRVGSPVPEPKD